MCGIRLINCRELKLIRNGRILMTIICICMGYECAASLDSAMCLSFWVKCCCCGMLANDMDNLCVCVLQRPRNSMYPRRIRSAHELSRAMCDDVMRSTRQGKKHSIRFITLANGICHRLNWRKWSGGHKQRAQLCIARCVI